MTRREVLNNLMIKENWGASAKEMNEAVDQALSALTQIEESKRLTVEEIKEIIKEQLGCNDHRGWNWDTNLEVFDKTFAIIPESQLKEMSQAIHEAQERKSKGDEK